MVFNKIYGVEKMNINKEDLILLFCKYLNYDRYSVRAEEVERFVNMQYKR